MSEVTFAKAKVGDVSYVYSRADGEQIDDFGWVTELEWFDDRYEEVRLRRQRWLLVSEDELVLPDPYARDELDEEDE